MENKNTGLRVLVIVLSVLVVILSGYIIYDKALSNDQVSNNDNEITNNNNLTDNGLNENNNVDNDNGVQDEQYLVSDFSGRVFNSKAGESQYYLTLWSDGKYMYTNDKQEDETLGEYKIEGNKIKLTYLYIIDRGDNKTSGADDIARSISGVKELNIVSLNKIVDELSNIELESVNQPASSGGENFNTILDSLMD